MLFRSGEAQIIKKIGGKEEVRSFLEKLGFVVGGEVTVISEIAGNMIDVYKRQDERLIYSFRLQQTIVTCCEYKK